MPPHELAGFLCALSDEELLSRSRPGMLTEEAQRFALAELRARGLPVPQDAGEPEEEEQEGGPAYEGDMVLLERGLTPQEAHLKASFLQSVDVAASAGDVNLVQTHGLLAIAVGGACLRVPRNRLEEATELLAAFSRGDFALGDDDDVGPDAAA
jgi:hypothetical protein